MSQCQNSKKKYDLEERTAKFGESITREKIIGHLRIRNFIGNWKLEIGNLKPND